jgi:REP element-mobilizing transposase RayT
MTGLFNLPAALASLLAPQALGDTMPPAGPAEVNHTVGAAGLLPRRVEGTGSVARVKHGREDWVTYHVTSRTAGRAFLLVHDEDKRVVISALDFYRRRGQYKLYAFVVMSNHLHVIIQPAPGIRLGDIVRNLKAWTSRHNRCKLRGRPLWERRYDDSRIKSAAELREVIRYIHDNPVRAGIAETPEEHAWSSVHNYAGSENRAMEIDSDWWQY